MVAVGWSTFGLLASQIIRFGGSLITTRLLAPDLYGVVAITITFLVALNMFSDLGLRQAVIQQESHAEPKTFETIWVLQIARGLVVFVLLLICAAAVYALRETGHITKQSVYGHPDFLVALLVLSITAVLQGLESLRIYLASRELNLKRLTLIELFSQCAALIFTVVWALQSPDIYSVTLGIVLAGVVRTVLSHTWLQGAPDRLGWSTPQAKKIIHFSKWLLLSSILGFFAGHGDRLLLGGLLTPEAFGIFTVAALLVGALYEVGSRIVSNVTYPALTEMHRNNPASLAAGFQKSRLVFDSGIAAVAGLFLVISPWVVDLLYDDRYLQAGQVLQILALTLMFQWTQAAMFVFLILGKPWAMTVEICIKLVAVLIFVPLLTQSHGLLGAAWALVLSKIMTLPYIYFLLVKARLFKLKNEIVPLLTMAAGAALGLLAIYLFNLPWQPFWA